jgi:hypothetical protein
MRGDADRAGIEAFFGALGREVRAPHTVYLAGGGSAVLIGWRASTIDIDVRAEPDSDELLRAISRLKYRLDVNVELAGPLDFLPAPPGWRDRSPLIATAGAVAFRHTDFRAQALAKLERGFDSDRDDVAAMLARGLVSAAELRAAFDAVSGSLFRYPAVDAAALAARVRALAD